MPKWLLNGENYIPTTDKDTFINKSILAMFGILSKIRTQERSTKEIFGISAVLKVFFTFMLIVFLSLSQNFTFIIVINVYLLVWLSFMEAKEIIKILRISFIMTTFTFFILLPSLFWGNHYNSIMITSKVLATLMAVNILSNSTKWNSITSALKSFFVPDIFILVMDITIKYIVLLGEFALNMLYSLKLRSVGKNKSKYTSLSGIAGTMFIKSKEMAEDMYSAMECRGYTGEYIIHSKLKLLWQDYIYIIVNIVIIVIFIYFERL
jgi:cobalt/nickel transport system permease protein